MSTIELSATDSSASGGAMQDRPDQPQEPAILRDLDGIVIDETRISSIDGERGELLYRGYRIQDVAHHGSFEEVCHLLLHGERPSALELQLMKKQLEQEAALPREISTLVRSMAHLDPAAVLRTVISALGARDESRQPSARQVRTQGLRLVAQVPTILATHHAARTGLDLQPPAPGLSHTERFLSGFFGSSPSETQTAIVDLTLILQADHGANPSSFAARVAASSGTSLAASIVAAIATLAGPTTDPRAVSLRLAAEQMVADLPENTTVPPMGAIEAVLTADEGGLGVSVDAYTAALYHLIGFPDDYLVALYVMSRAVGWTAQIAEQVERNVPIRPRLVYRGPGRRSWNED